jgi:hypothetical protein
MPSCLSCNRWYSEEDGFCGCQNELITMTRKELDQVRGVIKAVDGITTCSDVRMSGKVYYRFLTTGQDAVIHQVKECLNTLKRYDPKR